MSQQGSHELINDTRHFNGVGKGHHMISAINDMWLAHVFWIYQTS